MPVNWDELLEARAFVSASGRIEMRAWVCRDSGKFFFWDSDTGKSLDGDEEESDEDGDEVDGDESPRPSRRRYPHNYGVFHVVFVSQGNWRPAASVRRLGPKI